MQKLLYLSGGKIIIKIPEVCYSVWIGLEIRKLVFLGGFFWYFYLFSNRKLIVLRCTSIYSLIIAFAGFLFIYLFLPVAMAT